MSARFVNLEPASTARQVMSANGVGFPLVPPFKASGL